MLKNALDSTLNLYNGIDGIVIANKDGIIEYCTIYDRNIHQYRRDTNFGKHILDAYPSLNQNSSSIMRVLKTGNPILFERQEVLDYNGNKYSFVNSTVPIISNGEIIGVIEISKFYDQSTELHNNGGKKYYALDDIITKDKKMLEIKEKLALIAKTDSTVLITGETGTGKELVAQSVHFHSKRQEKPFIALNCAAIPENLMESALFGTMKGAYTGAENKEGLIEEADGGTLFLDEIHTMPLNLQAKLLRFLEDRRVRRLGGGSDKEIDVRVIAAMNVKGPEAVNNKLIREDLYYRLGVVKIDILPLRERIDDIPVLIDHFITLYNKLMGKSIKGVSELAMNALLSSEWRGNVRELKNTIEGAFNLVQGDTIHLKDLPEQVLNVKSAFMIREEDVDQQNMNLNQRVEIFERELIIKALNEAKLQTEAAKKLGISRQSLRYKIEKYGLNQHK